MISKALINDKYNTLLPQAEQEKQFLAELKHLKQTLNLSQLKLGHKPLLVYTNKPLDPLHYLLCVTYSLQESKVLDYLSVRAQTFIRQHFADVDRDQSLYDEIYYTDILFVVLTQADYTSEYLETLLQDLVDFRRRRQTYTILIYEDINESQTSQTSHTVKLKNFFNRNSFPVVDLIDDITTTHSATQRRKQRII